VRTCQECESIGFGIRGTTTWCQCCGQNCLDSQAACISDNQFCETRCLTTDGGRWCSGVTTPPPTTSSTVATTTSTATTTTAPSGIDCAKDCPAGIYGVVGAEKWCKCCKGNCGGGYKDACISDENFCVEGAMGRCFEFDGICQDPTTTLAPTTTTTLPPTTSTSTIATTTTTIATTSSTSATTLPSETTTISTTDSVQTSDSDATTSAGPTPQATTTTSAQTADPNFQSCFPFKDTPDGSLQAFSVPCAAPCASTALSEEDWDTGVLITFIFALLSLIAVLAAIIGAVAMVLPDAMAVNWIWIGVALLIMMIGVILSYAVGPSDVFCVDEFTAANEDENNAACQAQGFLIYFGALSATLWTTFVAWQASNTAKAMATSSAATAEGVRTQARQSAPHGATLIVLHVAAWVLPLLGAILSVATGHIRYPRDDLGLWCFVDDDQGLAWPWGFFFAPMALLAILTLVGAVLTLVRRSALDIHQRDKLVPYLSAFVIVYALLVLIWVITRLASDASGSRVDRASSLQERARCHIVEQTPEKCDEAWQATGHAPSVAGWYIGAIAATLLGLLLPLLLIGTLAARKQQTKDEKSGNEGLDIDGSQVFGGAPETEGSSIKTVSVTHADEMAIYDNVDEDSSESVSIRILDDNDDEESDEVIVGSANATKMVEMAPAGDDVTRYEPQANDDLSDSSESYSGSLSISISSTSEDAAPHDDYEAGMTTLVMNQDMPLDESSDYTRSQSSSGSNILSSSDYTSEESS